MEKKKVLIIKTGYCEFLDKGSNSRKVSLGDILRTTVILHPYKESHVTWVTDAHAFPLLEGNSFIDRLLIYDFTTSFQLESEEFDTVINLEKVPGICALSDKIKARKSRYGFTFNTQTGDAEALETATEILAFGSDPILKRENKKNIQELLFEMVGKKWAGEEYILGYTPKGNEEFDIAFNVYVGEKWPTKSWSTENWDSLEDKLTNKGFKITRQDKQDEIVLKNLYSYTDWINSAKIIVTNDSLGLHLGLALNKKVLGLFGPTPHNEIYFYKRGKAITPKTDCNLIPCFNSKCDIYKNSCIDLISPEQVIEEILKINY
jgi:heptosyltransferase II